MVSCAQQGHRWTTDEYGVPICRCGVLKPDLRPPTPLTQIEVIWSLIRGFNPDPPPIFEG